MCLTIPFGSAAATAQCNPILQSGGPIPALRGRVFTSVRWDPDGAGPLPQWLVVGGNQLTGGDQVAPVGLLAYDGTQWRSLGFDVDQTVMTMTVFQGDLVVAGFFTLPVAGGNANNIARRSGNAWFALGAGTGGAVRALTLYSGELVAGGSFFTAGGQNIRGVARWNGTIWQPMGAATPPLTILNGNVRALATMGSLYVGGVTGGLQSLFRWDGTSWSNIGAPISDVTALGAFNGTTHGSSFLIAAGAFSSIGGVPAARVGRSFNGTVWSAMSTGLPQLESIQLLVRAPFLGTPEVIATGRDLGSSARVKFWNGTTWSTLGNLGPAISVGAATAPEYYGGYVVGWDDPSALRSPSMFRFANDWEPLLGRGIPAPVQCLAADGQDLIAGGAFTTIDGLAVNGIARRSGTGSGAVWNVLGAGVSGGGTTVNAVVRASNGEVFAGGSFTTAGGVAASNIARWNGTAWAPLGTGINGTVLALVQAANGDLIAGGDFTSAGGVACNRVARWNGTAWSQLASGMDGVVRCLAALPNGEIVAGGLFSQASGQTCNRVARWNGFVWNPMSTGMGSAVYALAVRPNGDVVAGGAFSIASGIACSRLARWNGATWSPMGVGVPDRVESLLALPNGDVLAGGLFATGPQNHLARWVGASDLITGVATGISGASVFAFAAAPNGDVFMGGDFDAILPNQVAGHLAILTTNCPALATAVPTACIGPAGPLALTADTLPWVGATFRSTATGYAPQALAVSAFGLLQANVPLSQLHPTGLPNCNLLTSTESLLLAFPAAGVSHHQLAVPNSAVFAGVQLSHQCLQLSLSGSGSLQSISSSNALTLVLGLL